MNITQPDREAAASILWVATLIDDEESIVQAFAAHRLAERERIVAWLKSEALSCDCFAREENECACGAWDDCKTVQIGGLIDAIERGDHDGGSHE